MKTTKRWLMATGVLLLAATSMQAQFSSFYRPLGSGFDHGIGREVIESFVPQEFMVVGTSYTPSPSNRPVVTLTKHGAFGLPLWSKIYPINVSTFAPIVIADGMSIALNPYVNEYAILAYAMATPAQAQSVLIRVDGAGNYLGQTELGNLRATSVVFDPASSNYAVLGQFDNTINGGDLDLQLTFVNAAGFILASTIYDSGVGDDRPARLCLNPISGNYTLVGTSFNGSNDDIFIVQTDNTASILIASNTYDAGSNEEGVDVTVSASNFTQVVVGHDATNSNPFLIEVNDITGTTLSIAALNPVVIGNRPTAITTDLTTGNYIICGEENATAGNDNGFLAIVDNNLNPIIYQQYGQPPLPGNERLTDILYSSIFQALFMAGEHELIGSWPGFPTPNNQYYSWLVRTDLMGNGTCSMPTGTSVATITFTATPSTFLTAVTPITTPVTIGVRQINNALLDECTNPFRLAAIEKENAISIFPNPATTQLTINNSSESVWVFEITNILGELIQSKTIPATSGDLIIDISNISPGVYLYRLKAGEQEVKSDKLIITQ